MRWGLWLALGYYGVRYLEAIERGEGVVEAGRRLDRVARWVEKTQNRAI